jgi:hypothetical protein
VRIAEVLGAGEEEGKVGVGVDVPAGGQRATGAVAEELAGAVGGMDGGGELGVKLWILLGQFLDEFCAGGKEFLFLELDAFPGRVGEDDVEAGLVCSPGFSRFSCWQVSPEISYAD